jgi:hypothetical protein
VDKIHYIKISKSNKIICSELFLEFNAFYPLNITNFMDDSASFEANNSSANQEIPRMFLDLVKISLCSSHYTKLIYALLSNL